MVELGDEYGLENLVEVLQAQIEYELAGYTLQRLDEALDGAIDEPLDR